MAEDSSRGPQARIGGIDPYATVTADPAIWTIVQAERVRAHEKHQATSMESMGVASKERLAILGEEYGEVCREFNDARHDGRPVDLAKLYKELVQNSSAAGAWADAVRREIEEQERLASRPEDTRFGTFL